MAAPRHPQQLALLLTLFVLNAIEFLQAGMIAFGAGAITGEIGATPEEFSLATALYACVAIAAISKQRWLVERLGWRRFIHLSIVVFLAGAAICADSHSFHQFLFGRAVMGLGGAAFMTSARLLITLLPGPQRLLGIKYFATALFTGTALAPWLASEAVARDSWTSIFGLLAVLAATAAVLASISLPTEVTPPAQRTKAHPAMLICMTGGSFLCLYALQRASYDFYSDLAPLLLAILAGALALAYFIRHQHDHESPFLVLSRMVQPRFLSGLAVFTLCYFMLGANNYMLPALTQRALGFPMQVTGQVQAAGMMSGLLVFYIMMWIIKKRPSPRKYFVTGFAALCGYGVLMAQLNGGADLWRDVMPVIAAFGAFVALVMATAAMNTFSGLAHDELAFWHAQQVKNMLSQFGLGLGTASAALSLQWRSTEHYAVLAERFSPGQAPYVEAVQQLSGLFSVEHGEQAGQLAVAQLSQLLTQQSTLLASIDYFWFVAAFAVAGAIVMWLQRPLR